MVDLPPEIEQELAALSDGEWSALTARLRAPDSTEALRTAASQHLSGDQLETFVRHADVSKFTDGSGAIDTVKVTNYLNAAFGIAGGQQQQPRWGQRSGGNAPGLRSGDNGRAAAAKRHGRRLDTETAAAVGKTERGAAGRAAAAWRFPQSTKDE